VGEEFGSWIPSRIRKRSCARTLALPEAVVDTSSLQYPPKARQVILDAEALIACRRKRLLAATL